jgi:hypothetical protein
MWGAVILALVAGWFAWARPPVHQSVQPSPGSRTTSSSPSAGRGPTPVFTIAHIRESGHRGPIEVYGGAPAGSVCVALPDEGAFSCDFLPTPGQAVHLAYAQWLYLDSACPSGPGCGFGMFVIGSISPQVAFVRVALGAGRSVNATLLTLPLDLEFPYRLFYVEKRTGFQSLNHHLPVVALNAQGRKIGHTSYLVLGG